LRSVLVDRSTVDPDCKWEIAQMDAAAAVPGLADHPDYEIKKELGRGGMGVGYLAQNKLMGRDEVLKVVGKHLIERQGVLDRFSREIRSAARLNHPNIVHAYSAFRCGDSLILAMEYVEGLDLARVVRTKGALPVANACSYVHQAALGLQRAHEHGMVHRDIKPGNLMLARKSDRAIVKVLDFGLAKATREDQIDGGLTHDGQMLGTPDFIAPEQIRDAQSADIRADVYSLGCTLFYLLTAGPPFKGTSLYDILQAHFSMDAKPLNVARPEVPAELAALVAKMMAKEPERRFQTPKEVAQALVPFFKKGETSLKNTGTALPQFGGTPSAPRAGDGAALAAPPASPDFAAIRTGPADAGETKPLQAAGAAKASSRRPPWLWPAAASGILLLGLVAVSGMVTTKTPKAVVEPVDIPGDAKVIIDGKEDPITRPGRIGPEAAVPSPRSDATPTRQAPAAPQATTTEPQPRRPSSVDTTARVMDVPEKKPEPIAERPAGAIDQEPLASRTGQPAGEVPSVKEATTPALAAFAPGSPEDGLAARGLTLLGSVAVVAEERRALDTYRQIRPLIDELSQAYGLYAQAFQNAELLAEMVQSRLELAAQIDALGKNLRGMPNGPRATSLQRQEYQTAQAYHDNLTQQRTQTVQTIERLEGHQVSPERKQELTSNFVTKKTAFLKAEPEFTKLFEKARQEYARLRSDKDVKELLEKIRMSTKTATRLGPSKQLDTAMNMVRRVKRECSSDMSVPKKKRQGTRH
jgi:serine/threonine protein kinase